MNMLGFLIGNAIRNRIDAAGDSVRVRSDPAVTGAVAVLEQRLDALELACAGLWTLLKERHGYTNEELARVIENVDAADGRMDGKITRGAGGLCPACGRKLLSRTVAKCLWCGAPISQSPLT